MSTTARVGARVGLLGHQIAGSLSPRLHRELYRLCGVDATYELWDVSPTEFPDDFKERILTEGWLGLNVTTPHKERAHAVCDRYSESALVLGAVNHLTVKGGQLLGDNKDVEGAYFTLQGIAAANKSRPPEWLLHLHVLGFGPAARAVVMGHWRYWRAERQRMKQHTLRDPGPARVSLYLREIRPEHESWKSKLEASSEGATSLSLHPFEALSVAPINGLLCNATTVKTELPFSTLPAGDYGVWDLNYGSPTTPLVTEAKRQGKYALDGLPMLVFQGFFSAARWFPDKIDAGKDIGKTGKVLEGLRGGG